MKLIKIKTNQSNLELIQGKLVKGDDGGYYKPAVDEEGNLTWIASEEDMPAVEGANILGPSGPSGVYVGDTEPTDESINVWIEPNGTPDTEYATKEYVEGLGYTTLSAVEGLGYTTMSAVEEKGYTTLSAVEGLGYQTADQVASAISSALGDIALAEDGEY